MHVPLCTSNAGSVWVCNRPSWLGDGGLVVLKVQPMVCFFIIVHVHALSDPRRFTYLLAYAYVFHGAGDVLLGLPSLGSIGFIAGMAAFLVGRATTSVLLPRFC